MPSFADTVSAAQSPQPVVVRLPITLGQFLKVAGIAFTGGEAKQVISNGEVTVNGCTETRRGRRLVVGDIVEAAGEVVLVTTPDSVSEQASAGNAPSDPTGR